MSEGKRMEQDSVIGIKGVPAPLIPLSLPNSSSGPMKRYFMMKRENWTMDIKAHTKAYLDLNNQYQN